jgi:hypothetical protein
VWDGMEIDLRISRVCLPYIVKDEKRDADVNV